MARIHMHEVVVILFTFSRIISGRRVVLNVLRPLSLPVDSGSIRGLDSQASPSPPPLPPPPKIGTCNSNFSGTLQSLAPLVARNSPRLETRKARVGSFPPFRPRAFPQRVKVDANRRSYYLVSIGRRYLVLRLRESAARLNYARAAKTYALILHNARLLNNISFFANNFF